MTIKTFYIDYNVTIKDELIDIVEKYNFKEWMISHEEFNSKGEPKPHFHFFVEFDDVKQYNNLCKKIITEYKLKELGEKYRKETGKTGYRNYGMLTKDITTPEYFKTYMAKDHSVWGSMSHDKIQSYIDASFKTKTETEFKEKCYKFVKLNYLKTKYKDMIKRNNIETFADKHHTTAAKLAICDFLRENDSTITRTKVQNHFHYFLTMYREKFSIGDIFNILDIGRN